jgi:hypothetical protein
MPTSRLPFSFVSKHLITKYMKIHPQHDITLATGRRGCRGPLFAMPVWMPCSQQITPVTTCYRTDLPSQCAHPPHVVKASRQTAKATLGRRKTPNRAQRSRFGLQAKYTLLTCNIQYTNRSPKYLSVATNAQTTFRPSWPAQLPGCSCCSPPRCSPYVLQGNLQVPVSVKS